MNSQQHLAVLDMSCQLPVFWLGKLCLTTMSEGVRTISDSLFKSVRQWGLNVAVHIVFTGMVVLNPRLTEAQQYQLMTVIARALEQLFVQHSLDERLVKAIVSLACPDRGSCILITYLLEVLKGLASSNAAALDLEAGQSDEELVEDAKAARVLHQEFFIDHVYVAAMPPSVRLAVLVALRRECKVRCCITLEPLVKLDGRIGCDVVALIQQVGDSIHAFLYRGSALYKWLGKRQVPTSPETRSVVRPIDVYRLS